MMISAIILAGWSTVSYHYDIHFICFSLSPYQRPPTSPALPTPPEDFIVIHHSTTTRGFFQTSLVYASVVVLGLSQSI